MTEQKQSATVKEYLRYFHLQRHPALFRDETVRKLGAVERRYGTREAMCVIYEIRLNREERGLDFSIGVKTPGEPSPDYWLELDEATWDDLPETPCRFWNANPLRLDDPDANGAFYDAVLRPAVGDAAMDAMRPRLDWVLSLTRNRCDGLYQIGFMRARGENRRLRIFTEDCTGEALLSMLADLGWRGNFDVLRHYLETWQACVWKKTADSKCFQLDFDLSPDAVSDKIGVTIYPASRSPKRIREFLELLKEQGLCLPDKAEGVGQWTEVFPTYRPFLQNDVCHFKFAFDSSGILDAKAYLRQSPACAWPGFRAFFRPAQMNLELTTRCPLHCPQCYVSLNTGRDLPLDEALYWLREAAENDVRNINLSGGETLCYPHLVELIRECKRLSLCSAVALSGAYATEEKLRELIDAGVNEIYVSLNGSTEEVNARTRDGYALAVRTLETLQRIGFAEYYVNWVMHASNAEDFENMLALCERYGVKGLAILAFKPDSSHALPDFPTAEQLRKVARIMKAYRGPLDVDAEPCFSQLRTLRLGGFLGNRNRGVFRGCGAGRDGVSVSAEGRLTPCRHLEIEEETRSLADYWENSPFLRRLREVEDRRETPCLGCRYEKYCLPCAAMGVKLHGDLRYGMEECPLAGTPAP